MIPVRGFEGKRVAVFGLGRTGLTAARALKAGGAELALWDESVGARNAAAAEQFPLVDLRSADWSLFDALMLSPGVPLTHPAPHWTVEMAKAAGVEVIGDIELFARTVNAAPEHKRPKVVAITGTNGKSTTTALIGHMLTAAGRDARIGGNIGYGVLGLDDMHGGAVYVLEVSSHQLDLTSSLKPDVAILLNITPDHLDRHGGMDGYVAAKRRVLLNQGKGDTAVIGVDDPYGQQICTEITAANRRTICPISSKTSPSDAASMRCRACSMTPPASGWWRSPIWSGFRLCPADTTLRTQPPPMPPFAPWACRSRTRRPDWSPFQASRIGWRRWR